MSTKTQLLDGMVVFTEVIDAGSFTKAADKISHSTSYISKEISKLENRLGSRLINRTTRSISLTPEGKLYYQQCKQIIDDALQIEALVNQRQLEPSGTLKVSCPVSFGFSHLRPMFANFLHHYPKVNLHLDVSESMVDIIADGFDVVIRGAQELEDSSLIAKRLLSSHGVSIASPKYLEKFGTPKHPKELENHQIISYTLAKTPDVWDFESHQGKKVSVKVNCKMLTNSPEMELEMVTSGLGITRMPAFYLGDKLQSGELVELFENYKRLPINLYVVYPSRKYMSAKVRHFIEFIMNEDNYR